MGVAKAAIAAAREQHPLAHLGDVGQHINQAFLPFEIYGVSRPEHGMVFSILKSHLHFKISEVSLPLE